MQFFDELNILHRAQRWSVGHTAEHLVPRTALGLLVTLLFAGSNPSDSLVGDDPPL